MNQPHILLTAPMHPIVEATLKPHAVLHRLWEQPNPAAALEAMGPQIRAMAASSLFGRVDGALLDSLPALEVIASFGVGYDHIDAQAAAERGIIVTNTPDVLTEEVADFTLGLLLATLRQIPQAERFVRDGHWLERKFPLSPSLRGRRVGIVGMGAIGKAVARRLEGFGVDIAYHSRHPQSVAYDYHPQLLSLARASDVLIVIVPGGAATRHLIDAEVLAALGPQGVLINVARGSVVDEAALIAALEAGQIWGAGLDVFADEPVVPPGLLALPHVVALPHIGSASEPTRRAMGQLVADNLLAWFARRAVLTPVAECRALLQL